MKIKPATVKGTRDFGSAELRKRNYIFDTIRKVFEKYGFQPIETPAFENMDILTGKYGDEGDKLLFRILNSGDYLSKADNNALVDKNSAALSPSIAEKGLRYDLTIPFARYVVQHQNDLVFPFKRYQIQPVWRADRPQKGRYREFYQCDADVIGSDSLLNEVELIMIYDEVFRKLGLDVTVKYNNRKIIRGLGKVLGDRLFRINNLNKLQVSFGSWLLWSSLDKYDKIGKEGVLKELEKNLDKVHEKLTDEAKLLIEEIFFSNISLEKIKDNYKDKLSEIFLEGYEEISTLNSFLTSSKLNCNIEYDIKLARGLNYYTGTIYEVVANGIKMGSIGGGGRYDSLTDVFGLKDMSGVGISFGVERIYDVMEELNLFDKVDLSTSTTKVLFMNFGGGAEEKAFEYVQALRHADIAAEIYPDNTKFKKQMKYADQKKIPFVVFIGDDELKSGELTMKNMQSGEQSNYANLNAVKDVLLNE